MTMQEFLTAAELHTTGNVLTHSYEVSNPMALSSYRHGTRKAATPVDMHVTLHPATPCAGGYGAILSASRSADDKVRFALDSALERRDSISNFLKYKSERRP
jgi:hypothetical protein